MHFHLTAFICFIVSDLYYFSPTIFVYYTYNSSASFSSNTITASQWSTLEQHGAAFLPTAGNRNGTSVSVGGSLGNYWSASYSSSGFAYYVYFYGSQLRTDLSDSCNYGRSVRLVAPA